MVVVYSLLVVSALLICIFADRIGGALRVIDVPDGERKTHARPTPLVGGLAVTVPLCAVAAIRAQATPFEPLYATLALAMAAFLLLGFVDDRRHIRATWRLLASFLICLGVIVAVPALQVSFLKFSFLSSAIFMDGWMGVVFSLLCLVGLQNAVNMADGRNGLVVSLSLLWCLTLFRYAPAHLYPLLAVLAAGLAVVLGFNLANRLFLGDSGSYALSTAIGLLTIYCYYVNFPIMTADVVALMFLIPVVDCLRLILLRVADGRSPFNPDNNHLHHILERLMPWDRALLIYLAIVGLPILLAMLWPRQTLLWAILALIVYAVLIGFGLRALAVQRRTA